MDYSEVPIPPETPEFEMEEENNEEIQEEEHSESGNEWLSQVTQQLVNAEKEMLQEKENGKRSLEDDPDEEPVAKKRANEFEKHWKNVNDNPADFQAWTVLLQHVDQISDLECGRDAYDSFFARYPYCYGYWKKYADLEKRKGTPESTLKVFNAGVAAIALSVDLWIHYMEYVTVNYAEDEEFVRKLFDRSIDSCGLDFRSDKLWDLYITWETNGKRWKNVTKIYDKLISIPVSKYLQHWQKFQEHIRKHVPKEILAAEEYLELRREVLGELNKPDSENPDEAPPGVESTPSDEQDGFVEDEDSVKLLRLKIMEMRQLIHETTAAMAKARWHYEDAIKRPYFHVKPLEKSQLFAWRNYLEFEIKEGDLQRIKFLFERCLIACAFYEEFWMRYIRYLEDHEVSEEELRGVYVRACTIHLREKLKPHLAWSAFEEEKGCVDYAIQILVDVQDRIDLSLEAYMMAVGVERRRGNMEAAEQIYKSCLMKFKDKDDKSYYSCIATKYARFLTLFKMNSDEAVEVIKQAQENDPSNFNLLVALADNAMACRPPKIDLAAEAFKSGTDSSFTPNVRLMFAHRYLHFVTECATHCRSMNEALRLLRKIQQEIREEQAAESEERSSPSKAADSSSSNYQNTKQSNMVTPFPDKSMANTMNGSVPPAVNQTQPQANYQNYQAASATPGYGYNQYQQPGYGGQQYHQGWGYPPGQQAGYGYSQQGWGNYPPNYYGQR